MNESIDRGGQVMMEFLIVISIVFIIGVIYIAIGSDALVRSSEERRVIVLNDVGFAIQDEMIAASFLEDGYRREFVVPDQAGRFAYALSSDDSSVSLSSGQTSISYPLPSYNGSVLKGTNILRKIDGALLLN